MQMTNKPSHAPNRWLRLAAGIALAVATLFSNTAQAANSPRRTTNGLARDIATAQTGADRVATKLRIARTSGAVIESLCLSDRLNQVHSVVRRLQRLDTRSANPMAGGIYRAQRLAYQRSARAALMGSYRGLMSGNHVACSGTGGSLIGHAARGSRRTYTTVRVIRPRLPTASRYDRWQISRRRRRR